MLAGFAERPDANRVYPGLVWICSGRRPSGAAPGQRLYKLLTVENVLRSIAGGYLHFSRIDAYADFPGADLLARAKGSRRRRKSASTLSGMPVPTRPA
jgi:hypothetical protein